MKRLWLYRVDELARILGAHTHTVRLWLKQGLESIDGEYPTLIRGEDAHQFLGAKQAKRRRTCPPGTLYCVKCREPRRPAGDVADLRELSGNTGDLQALCPVCISIMHRRVNLGAMAGIWSGIVVTTTHRERRLGETT